jgi:hypothetical protein
MRQYVSVVLKKLWRHLNLKSSTQESVLILDLSNSSNLMPSFIQSSFDCDIVFMGSLDWIEGRMQLTENFMEPLRSMYSMSNLWMVRNQSKRDVLDLRAFALTGKELWMVERKVWWSLCLWRAVFLRKGLQASILPSSGSYLIQDCLHETVHCGDEEERGQSLSLRDSSVNCEG